MQPLRVGLLIGLVHSLACQVSLGRDESAPLEDGWRDLIARDLRAILAECEALGLIVPTEHCRMLLEMLAIKGGMPNETGAVARAAAMISNTMHIEMKARRFFALAPEHVRFYEPSDTIFGVEFGEKFPSAIFDADEAGKCFAVGRHTACVFHLMRVMETAVRATARCLAISDPLKPAERNWGFVLNQIKRGIDARWPDGASRFTGDGALFERLYVSLDAVRNPWRNGTMHVENEYTQEEAEHILIAVRGFVTKLASRMDQQGLPLA